MGDSDLINPSTTFVVDLTSDDGDDEDEPPLVAAHQPNVMSPLASGASAAPDCPDNDDENQELDSDEYDDDTDNLSIFEEHFSCTDQTSLFPIRPEYCTPDESARFKKLLRSEGVQEFVRLTIEDETITAKKLITAFGVHPPAWLEGQPDEAYYSLLGLVIRRELSRRIKLPQYNSVDDVVKLLQESKNIVVVTGAGISTSLGIPDFRSKDTGFYAQLEHLGLGDPQEVFDINLFREDPRIFYSIAKGILPSSNRYTPTHAFIRLLQDKGKLLTNFTQNIDNLEGHAGILKEKLVQCHGSFGSATCQTCRLQVAGSVIYDDLRQGQVARCKQCMMRLKTERPGALKRKRSSNGLLPSKSRKRQYGEDSDDQDDEYETEMVGIMKPDITFFGEDLPDAFHDRLVDHDRDKVDLVVVIGTSLKVAPVSEIPAFMPSSIPQIYISRDPCGHVNFDIDLMGNCDTVVVELCRRAGWELRHEMIPENEKVHVESVEGYESRHAFKVVKD